jgi:hypothetical protein
MPNTFELIASSTVGSGGAANIDFSSIPSTYTDLKLCVSLRTSAVSVNGAAIIQFNSSTTNYSSREIVGDGSNVSSSSRTVLGNGLYIGNLSGNSATSNTFGTSDIYIPNYTSSNYKSLSIDSVSENNGTTAYATFVAGLWSDTSSITSITLSPFNTSTFLQYSTAYLYGISKS